MDSKHKYICEETMINMYTMILDRFLESYKKGVIGSTLAENAMIKNDPIPHFGIEEGCTAFKRIKSVQNEFLKIIYPK